MRCRVGAGVGLLGLMILAGCSTAGSGHVLAMCSQGRSFELSLASDIGGQATPEDAASRARVPGFALPKSGWQIVSPMGASVSLRSGGYQVHAIQGPDKTWQVDSGGHCDDRAVARGG